jgi:dihydrofolate reductase
MQRLIGIVAMTQDRVIGHAGTLPWHLPDDLAFFKRTTSGHPIVMGRKTFDSIGRPLPKRKNIVLTRDSSWSHPGVLVIHEVSELAALTQNDDIVYVIGGAEIYQAFLPQTQELLITHVHASHQGDTHFPEYAMHFPVTETVLEHEMFTVKRHAREVKNF